MDISAFVPLQDLGSVAASPVAIQCYLENPG